MMIGGEAFPAALAKQLKESVRGSIHNMYGPTETTVWSATDTLDASDGVVPIGRPIANTKIYLLDSQLQLVTPGVVGEICIGGLGVSGCSASQSARTTRSFIITTSRSH